MIYVFGPSLEWVDGYAWDRGLWDRGLTRSRCYSPASRSIRGLQLRAADEVHLVLRCPPVFVAEVNWLIAKSRGGKPTVVCSYPA